MSLDELESAIAALPDKERDVDEVERLAAALGSKIGRGELDRLAALLRDDGAAFTPRGRAALQRLVALPDGADVTALTGVALALGRAYSIDVAEPSGLTFVSRALGFLTVGDDSTTIVRLATPAEDADHADVEKLEVGDHRHLLRGLEGIAYDADAHALLVISEDTRVVSELAVALGRTTLTLGDPIKRKTLDEIGQDKRSGWEGIALLPAKLSPDRKARLLAINERQPRGIGVFDRGSFELQAFITLPDDLAEQARDLSDIAVDARSGHIFLLSDESQAVLEVALAAAPGAGAPGWSISAVARTSLPDSRTKRRLQPEGLAFDDRGDLWVVSEGDRTLRHLIRGG
jgi:uncharacterized protein YjiK